jgi:hypothetical protein
MDETSTTTEPRLRDVAELREEVRRDLQAAIFAEDVPSLLDLSRPALAPEFESALERAQAIRELTAAYVTLGGKIEVEGSIAPPRPAPALDVEALARDVWKRVGNAGASTLEADRAADAVREALA